MNLERSDRNPRIQQKSKKNSFLESWMKRWIYLIWIYLSISCCWSQECSQHSLAVLVHKTFDRKSIQCSSPNGPDQLCDLKFLWPNTITCFRPENKLPSPWTSRSPA